jgi:transcriptional regulator with XRE-family HTH domain
MSTAESNDPIRSRVAANVRMHRQARRLTLEELSSRCAEIAGLEISAAALLRVEQAKRGVEAGDLVGLALALTVSVPDLLAPSVDDEHDDVPVGAGTQLPVSDYLAVIGTPGHAGTAGQAVGEAVVIPADQLRAIASAFAAVGVAAGEAARQFSLVTGNGTTFQALAAAAGDHASPAGRNSARLRQVGYTTEQLRDRFGPSAALAEAAAE